MTRSQLGYSIRAQPTAGSWLVIVSAGIDPHTGNPRQVRKVVHATSETKAHKAAQKILPDLHERADMIRNRVDIKALMDAQPELITIDYLTEQWLENIDPQDDDGPPLLRRNASARLWRPLDLTKIVDLTEAAVEEWFADMRSDGVRGSVDVLQDLMDCLQWGLDRYGLPAPALKYTRTNNAKLMTLGALTDQWLRARRSEGTTATTMAQYETNAERWRSALGQMAVADLEPEDVDAWSASLVNANGEPLASSTLRQILGDLHNCLTWGHEKRRLPTPVTTHATRPRHTKKTPTMPSVEALLDAVDALEAIGSDVSGMALLALGQGLRAGEVCGLRWVDVGPRLRVAGALKSDGSWGETKGRRERVVPISAIGKKGIDLAERLGDDSSPWLWPTPADPDKARRPHWLSGQWRALAPVVGLDGLTFHGLRHAAGSTLLRGGVPVPVVSEILGHADSRVTMEVYAHVMGGLTDDAMGPLDAAFTRQGEQG